MCTANCEGFYGTPSARIFMCTATKIYIYIHITHPYLLHCSQRELLGVSPSSRFILETSCIGLIDISITICNNHRKGQNYLK